MNELPEVPDTNLLPFDENLDGGQQFDVEKIVVHPKFNPFTYEHDIALITLKNRDHSYITSALSRGEGALCFEGVLRGHFQGIKMLQ